MLGAFIMTVILRQYWLRLGMWYLEVQPAIDCLLTGSNDCNKHWRHQLKQTDEYSPSRRCLWHSEVWGNQSHQLALVSLSASGLLSGCWCPLGCSLQRPEVPGDGITWEAASDQCWKMREGKYSSSLVLWLEQLRCDLHHLQSSPLEGTPSSSLYESPWYWVLLSFLLFPFHTPNPLWVFFCFSFLQSS